MNNRPRIISGIVTAVLAIIIIVILVSWHLNVNLNKGKQWPPVKEFELIAQDIEDPETFVSTYSSAADDVWEPEAETDSPGASDIESDTDTQTSYDLDNSGQQQGHHANLTSSEKESPVQQKPANEGTSKPDDAARLEARASRNRSRILRIKSPTAGQAPTKAQVARPSPRPTAAKTTTAPEATSLSPTPPRSTNAREAAGSA